MGNIEKIGLLDNVILNGNNISVGRNNEKRFALFIVNYFGNNHLTTKNNINSESINNFIETIAENCSVLVKPNSFSIVGSFIRGNNKAEKTINISILKTLFLILMKPYQK